MASNVEVALSSQHPMLPTLEQPDDQRLSRSLHDSVHSLAASRSQSSQVIKTYRQSVNLFLTRRFPEALSTIEPIITPQQSNQSGANGSGEEQDERQQALAPLAFASRATRIKVWNFWLTFLHQVVDLGAEEGKHAFGTTKWKALASKARDGTVWDDVVRDGYGGVEGSVEPEVVVSL